MPVPGQRQTPTPRPRAIWIACRSRPSSALSFSPATAWALSTAGAVHGAINVVLRNDLDGFETRAIARRPSQEGGEGRQGSAFWGGAVGKGKMTSAWTSSGARKSPRRAVITAAPSGRRAARSTGRRTSASAATPSGSFSEKNKRTTGVIRSVALGECDPAKGYTARSTIRPDPASPPATRAAVRLRRHHVERRQPRAAERGPESGTPARRRRRPPPGRESHAERFGVPLCAVGRLVWLQSDREPAMRNQRRRPRQLFIRQCRRPDRG